MLTWRGTRVVSSPTMIALAGRLGSGKDTVLERMQALDSKYVRHSFADKLKDSACALLGMDRATMEEFKRDEDLALVWDHPDVGVIESIPPISMRTFLQRYGTESHRDIFGQSFWVDQAMGAAEAAKGGFVPVFTDCRFVNEAEAIIERGGVVWRVAGPDEDTGDHASEQPLPDYLISHVIDNTVRDDGFTHLDAEVRAALQTLTGAA